MSVVIIGGNEGMIGEYEKICKNYGHTAKIFIKEKGGFKRKLGTPDLMILFTNTVSHKMVNSAMNEAKKANIRIAWANSSSKSALINVLKQNELECSFA